MSREQPPRRLQEPLSYVFESGTPLSAVARYLPLVFFGVLLATRLREPTTLVFDEIHYIPAAKSIAAGAKDLNWVHPPFAKYILALGWLLLSKTLGLFAEPEVFRLISAGFGLWALWSVRAWMRALGYGEAAAQTALWLTGFNFLWFVQSKTAMLDIFYAAFSLWGLLFIYRAGARDHSRAYWGGWALLGLAMASKWAAAPFFALAMLLSKRPFRSRVYGVLMSFGVYVVSFIPVLLLKGDRPGITSFLSYHKGMFDGMNSIATAPHPYVSSWWQWPTLLRPMWYTFENVGPGERSIWAGGNPVLYLVAFPLLFVVVWFAIPPARGAKGEPVARRLALLYWLPLLFWAIAPRKLQLYYYYLVPSFWLGPLVVWAHERFYERVSQTRGWLLFGFLLLCALTFIYFLPIMDGRVLPPGRYQQYMWFRRWI